MVSGLKQGRYHLFWNDHGCCVAEIIQYPQKRVLNCWIVAGQLPGVMDLQGQVDAFAKDNRCDWMTTTARPGWLTVLPQYGWKKDFVMLTKDVPNG